MPRPTVSVYVTVFFGFNTGTGVLRKRCLRHPMLSTAFAQLREIFAFSRWNIENIAVPQFMRPTMAIGAHM